MMPKMFAPTVSPEVARRLRAVMEGCPAKTIQYALAGMRDREDLMDLLPQVKAPTLIIVGESDVLTTPAMAEMMHKAIGHSEMLVVSGAGHMSNMEKPAQVNAAMSSFLAKCGL
jgi:3-oxoadipate enol-lactonase